MSKKKTFNQRVMRVFLSFILTAVLFNLSSLLYANTINQSRKLELQQSLEGRISPLAKLLDKDAIVIIDIALKKSAEQNLPLTPFIVKESVMDPSEEGAINSIKINIISSRKTMPQELEKLMLSILAEYSVNTSVVLSSMPDLTNVSESKNADGSQKEVNGDAPMPTEWSARWPWFKDMISKEWSRMNSWRFVIPIAAIYSFIIFFAIQLTVFVGLWLSHRRSKELLAALQQGLSAVSQGIETSSLSGGSSRNDFSNVATQATQRMQNATANSDTAKNFASFSKESIHAMLYDCYWCQMDGEASYIWRLVPINVRTVLLASDKNLNQYVKFLSTINETPSNIDQDPYYLSPLPIHHLDNEHMAGIVRENPALLYKLSLMRQQSIPLFGRERLEFANMATDLVNMPDFSTLPASESRTLKVNSYIEPKDLQEEEELLALGASDGSIQESVRSLGWLTALSENSLRQIFSKYSARDLASAWIGPEAVLEKLSSYVGDKKMKIIDSYLSNQKPSRQSGAFFALHQDFLAAQKMEAENPVVENDQSTDNSETGEEYNENNDSEMNSPENSEITDSSDSVDPVSAIDNEEEITSSESSDNSDTSDNSDDSSDNNDSNNQAA